MSEVIFFHIGQAGVQIGQSLWDLMYQQHMSADGQLGQISSDSYDPNVVFHEVEEGEWKPRAVIFDLGSFWL